MEDSEAIMDDQLDRGGSAPRIHPRVAAVHDSRQRPIRPRELLT